VSISVALTEKLKSITQNVFAKKEVPWSPLTSHTTPIWYSFFYQNCFSNLQYFCLKKIDNFKVNNNFFLAKMFRFYSAIAVKSIWFLILWKNIHLMLCMHLLYGKVTESTRTNLSAMILNSCSTFLWCNTMNTSTYTLEYQAW